MIIRVCKQVQANQKIVSIPVKSTLTGLSRFTGESPILVGNFVLRSGQSEKASLDFGLLYLCGGHQLPFRSPLAGSPTNSPFFHVRCAMSFQAAYSANLKKQGRGVAVYHPLIPRQYSHAIGDIAFFDGDGKYRRIANAFDSEVCFNLL